MMISTVFFDFYGVLYPDTFWGVADAFVPVRDDAKQQALQDLIRRVNLGQLSRTEFWGCTADECGVTVGDVMKEKEKMGGVDPRLLEIAATLKGQGVTTGIISNVGVGFIDKIIDEQTQKDHFDVLVFSGEVGIVKPDTRIFDIAVQRAGAEAASCIFFDDVERNVAGAQAAGLQGVHYTGIESCTNALKAAGLLI